MLNPSVMIPCSTQDLRWIRAEEAEIFAAWEKGERPYPWKENHFLETLKSPSQRTLVWEDEGKILGFAVIQMVHDEAYLLNIMVAKDERGKGHGTQLLQKAMRWLKESGVNRLLLDVDPENESAVHLYKKVGFEVAGRRSKAYPKGEDSLLLRKNL